MRMMRDNFFHPSHQNQDSETNYDTLYDSEDDKSFQMAQEQKYTMQSPVQMRGVHHHYDEYEMRGEVPKPTIGYSKPYAIDDAHQQTI